MRSIMPKSPPEEKFAPSPRTITTRTASSASMARHTPARSRCMSSVGGVQAARIGDDEFEDAALRRQKFQAREIARVECAGINWHGREPREC